jgi:GLPGLI family protein
MKKYLILLIIFLLDINTYAQKSNYKTTYICKTNIGSGKGYDGLNTLYFNTEGSVYIHNSWPKEDSYSDNGMVTGFIKGDMEEMPVFINLLDSQIIYKMPYKANPTKGCLILTEKLPKINWVVMKDTKKIGSYDCIKAAGEFGNRVYDVWFTPTIPCSFGPYKLNGLPGLILEAKSRDGRVSYEFNSFEATKQNAKTIDPPKVGKLMTWKQLEQYLIDELVRVEAMSTSEVTLTNVDPLPDFYIEKSKFTIISEYKRKRNLKKH